MTATAAAESGQGMLSACIVAGRACVTASIARLIAMEVVEGLRAVFGERSMVAVVRIVAVVDMAVKAVRAVEPGAGSDENSAVKPVGPIVAIGGTVIGSVVEVPIGAPWRHSNADADLGRCHRSPADYCRCENRDGQDFGCGDTRKGKNSTDGHNFSLIVKSKREWPRLPGWGDFSRDFARN
jgi:hypothetical protein